MDAKIKINATTNSTFLADFYQMNYDAKNQGCTVTQNCNLKIGFSQKSIEYSKHCIRSKIDVLAISSVSDWEATSVKIQSECNEQSLKGPHF